MTKLLAVVVATATLIGWGVTLQAEAEPVTCDGSFPIFDNTAMTEQENKERIACVDERRQVIRDSIAERRETRKDITHRIEQLRERKQRVTSRIERDKERAKPLSEVLRALNYIRGNVAWVWTTSTCESGNNPEAHNDTGKFHGMGQFMLSTWNSLGWAARYGNDDPHTEAAIIQAAGMVELLNRSGDEQWPTCGD